MAQEGVLIQIHRPLVLHLVEVGLEIVLLFRGDGVLFWRLDGDGIALVGVEPRHLPVGIGVNLEEIAARQRRPFFIGRGHLRDIHTVFMNLHLVAQLITAFVLTIEQHIDSGAIRRIGHAHPATQLKG